MGDLDLENTQNSGKRLIDQTASDRIQIIEYSPSQCSSSVPKPAKKLITTLEIFEN
jgi:hypothetical protein